MREGEETFAEPCDCGGRAVPPSSSAPSSSPRSLDLARASDVGQRFDRSPPKDMVIGYMKREHTLGRSWPGCARARGGTGVLGYGDGGKQELPLIEGAVESILVRDGIRGDLQRVRHGCVAHGAERVTKGVDAVHDEPGGHAKGRGHENRREDGDPPYPWPRPSRLGRPRLRERNRGEARVHALKAHRVVEVHVLKFPRVESLVV